MKWQGRRQSTNIEDRRRMSRGGLLAGGGITGIIVIIAALLLGVDPTQLLQQVETTSVPTDLGGETATEQQRFTPEEEARKQFTAVVLADTEDIWNQQLRAQLGEDYREPKLVLFSGYESSACGRASTATGPFYCAADARIYLDLDFFVELEQRFGAGGDFAQAYVVAHEVGHHIQNQLGILEQVRLQSADKTREQANQLSVRTELQADFLAGIWAHYAHRMKGTLEPGDVEEALNAATAIGDDRLQKMQQGYVIPDSFTHGTSEQRMRWFKLGFETGDLSTLMDLFRIDPDLL
jgi:predicted metalloprotease